MQPSTPVDAATTLPVENQPVSTPNPAMKVPAAFEHCREVWYAMYEESQVRTFLMNGEETSLPVYKGFLTKLFQNHRLSVPLYTSVMKALQTMDCVRQIRRGGGSSKSEWALLQEPSIEMFRSTMLKSKPPPAGSNAQVLQMIRDLNRRVTELERRVDNDL